MRNDVAEQISAASATATATVTDTVAALRAQVDRLQGRSVNGATIPTHAALAELLPGRGLRAGSSYTIGSSMSLVSALLHSPTRDGSWCAVVGMPEFGAEAAAHLGVELSRVVLVPEPGPRWLAITAALAEVMTLVVLRPPGRAKDTDMARLSARLRDRDAVLAVQGRWPQTDALIDVEDARWTGLGDGYGILAERELTVTVSSRRFPAPRRGRMLLPSPDGTLTRLPQRPAMSRPVPTLAPMKAVG